MSGVTILDTIEIYQLSGWQFLLAMLPLIISAIILFVRMYKAFKKGTKDEQAMYIISSEHWSPKEFIILVVGAILAFILMFSLENFCPADYAETRYKVTIDETTPFVEFNNKYNIIEEHTDYFIITEKSN